MLIGIVLAVMLFFHATPLFIRILLAASTAPKRIGQYSSSELAGRSSSVRPQSASLW